MGCFNCMKSSKIGDCGVGCCCCKKSSEEEASSARRRGGMCCFLCFKSSEPSRRRGQRGMCCFCCNKSSKKGDSSRRGESCFCCNKSSKKGESSRRGESCFCCKKSSKKAESSRRGESSFCCNKSSKEESSGTREKGMCCFSCKKSTKESSRRGKGLMGCLCCFESSLEESEESSSRREKGEMCCLCLSKSSDRKSSRRKGGCFHCTKSSDEKESSCFCCHRSSKDSKGRGEEAKCCSCFGKSSKERKSSQKRKCGLMNCLCCSKSPDQHNNKSTGKRMFCWKKKKEQRKGNQLAVLVKNISFKSDSGKHRSAAEEILRIGNGNIAARVFTYHELAAATKNFKAECLLGEGGFGRVYKGQIEGTNEIVAVKQLNRKGYQGNREFLIEVLMLSLLHHPNLVNLLGYCADGDQRLLVYDYMPLGSLQDHLLDMSPSKKPLAWETRMKIAAGTAKGLEYLHVTANPPVIYRDFKASNILLDIDYNPRLSDFGLAKLGPVGDKSHISTRVMGTYGYCAPEYALTGQLTKMSDVYSFGVVLLELITGRKAIDIKKPRSEQHLVQWAGPLFKDKKRFIEMADPLLEGKFPVKGLYQALAIAAMCLQEEANTRPLITDVVTALDYLAIPNSGQSDVSEESLSQKLHPPGLERSTSGSYEEDKKQSESSNDWESCSTTREEEALDMA